MTELAVLASDPSALERSADPAAFVVLACERAKAWLTQALDQGDIDSIAETKAQAEAIRVYTAQKQLGHDAELAAAEIVRRAERGIGVAIRRGQEAGEIRRRGERVHARNQHGDAGEGSGATSTSPGDFFKHNVEREQVYIMADEASDEQFDAVLEEAKAEGNLTRANVVRKVRRTTTETTETVDPDSGEIKPLDRTSQGSADRRRRIRELADTGRTSAQIATEVGISEIQVRKIARDMNVTITADKVLAKSHRLRVDANHVVEQTVRAAEPSPMLAAVNPAELNPELLEEWISSLSESIKALRSLKATLEKELSHVRA